MAAHEKRANRGMEAAYKVANNNENGVTLSSTLGAARRICANFSLLAR